MPPRQLPFQLASATLAVGALAVLALERSSPLGPPSFVAALAAAMAFLALPSWLEHKARVLDGLGATLAELQERHFDLDGVRREHRRTLARTEEVAETLAGLKDELAAARHLQEQLLAARQDRQRLERRLEDWQESLVDFCDSQFRLLSQPGLSEEYREAGRRSLQQLQLRLQSLGLDLVLPTAGEPFDARLHQAVASEPGDAPADHVLACRRLGVRRGDLVLRRAEVILSRLQEVPA